MSGWYEAGGRAFSLKECAQLVDLLRRHSHGEDRPVDARRYTRNVLKHAKLYDVLALRPDGRYVFTRVNTLGAQYVLPPAALWEAIRPMIERASGGGTSCGHTLANDQAWTDLNIYPATSHHYGDRDRDEQVKLLIELQGWGALIFQCAADIWRVTPTPDRLACYDETEYVTTGEREHGNGDGTVLDGR